ncbi:MAG: folate-binding protein [Synechococcaceae cyanobacterium]|nr:folate-binding protein [Synechococcaceae cyanobacterium]
MNRPDPAAATPPGGAAGPWTWAPPAPARIERRVGLLRLDGPDTLRFLHGQTSQDLQQARPGQRLATCALTPTGRLRALAEVLVDDAGAWLVITAGEGAAVRAALDRVLFPADDVRLGEPAEALLVESLEGGAVPALPEARGSWAPRAEGGLGLGERLLLTRGERLPEELARLPLLEPWAVEFLRIRRGVPAAPAEVNDGLNPFEVGLAPWVSLAKGCYVGQETLARLATYDGVRQQLRRWALAGGEGTTAPGAGATLCGPDGERAGTLTSVLELPRTGGPGPWTVGLALVRRAALGLETLRLAEGGSGLAMSVPEGFVAPPVGAGGQPSGGAPAS